MLRVCVIGLDVIGNLHADAYCASQLAQLLGVCDVNPQRAQAAGLRLGVRAFADAAEMLDTLRPDLVSVCTGSAQAEVVAQALDRGCDVLCEAPLAQDAAQARELVEKAAAAGRRLAVDFNLRFTPAALRAKQGVTEGRLGSPLFLNSSLWSGAETCAQPGCVWRLAHHGVDFMRWLSGGIVRVHCFAVKAAGGTEWSSAQINLQFSTGVVGGLTLSRDMVNYHPFARCEVAGTSARLVIDNIYEEITFYPYATEEKTVITNSIFGGLGGYDDTHRCRIERLLEQVSAGAAADEIEGSGAEALVAHAAVEAAMKSLEIGDVVNLGEVAPGG